MNVWVGGWRVGMDGWMNGRMVREYVQADGEEVGGGNGWQVGRCV